MKKYLVVLLTILVVVIFSACSALYSVKKNKQGIFDITEQEFNLLVSKDGDAFNQAFFNLMKFSAAGKDYYGVKIIYKYGNRYRSGITFGGDFVYFNIKHKDGVKITLNGNSSFMPAYKTVPVRKTSIMRSSTGPDSYTEEVVECYLSSKQLYALVSAKSAELDLTSSENYSFSWNFTKDNLDFLKKFYKEEVYGKK